MSVSKEAAEARAAYLREWRKANKEKCAEYRRKYWEKKAAQAGTEKKKAQAGTEKKKAEA